MNVFRKYGGPGGLKEEFVQTARRHPLLTKLVTIGKTTNGQDIIAIKVTLGAPLLRDGSKPSTLYIGAQHAREWITPEMNRRRCTTTSTTIRATARSRELAQQRELWIVQLSNPDGYDFTFQPDKRPWRKNLRDNNGDGKITPGDGVDLNRNYAYKWGYDNEGSSPDPSSETYRGPGPNSSPRPRRWTVFVKRVDLPNFLVNYHSAASCCSTASAGR